MTTTRRPARAFMLVELVWVILLSAAFLGILGKLTIDGLYLLRVAGQHSDRMAVMDSLARRLRTDALRASAYRWDGRTLTLIGAADGPDRDVRYVVDADRAQRVEGGLETHQWQVFRLRFAGACQRGPRADVLRLEFVEQPPERAGRLPDRRFTLGVLLPPAARDGPPTSGGGLR
jgi:hypothetical protein